MQDRTVAGQDGSRTGRLQDSTGQEGCRTGRLQDRTVAGQYRVGMVAVQEGCRTALLQDRTVAELHCLGQDGFSGQEGWRTLLSMTGWLQNRTVAELHGCRTGQLHYCMDAVAGLNLLCSKNRFFKTVLRSRSRWSRNYFGTWSRSQK